MSRSRIISALDVGSSKIATLIAQIEEGGAINIIGSSATPSAGIKRGQVINIEEATRAIIASVEAAERMAGFNLTNTLISVGGAHIISQNSRGVVAVTNPGKEVINEDVDRVLEAARAISLPASREILHVLPRTYTVDSQEGIIDPIGMSGVRLEVETHIITASSSSLKNLQRCIGEVGSSIEGFVFTALASASVVTTATERELGVTLIDIGGGTTSVAIFAEGSPIYSLVIPIGAKNITNDLAIGLRLSIDDAEKLKLVLGQDQEANQLVNLAKNKKASASKKADQDDPEEIDLEKLGIKSENKKITKKMIIEEIIRPRLEEIFGLIYDELKRNDLLELTPAGVVLTGGGAQTASAVEICRRTMALPVRIGIPQDVTGLVDDILTPEFATTIGLILYGQKHNQEDSLAKPRSGNSLPNLPIKSTFKKTVKFIKSFLP